MINLFSTFHPLTSTNLSRNLMSTFIYMTILPPMFWIKPSHSLMGIKVITLTVHKEYKTSIKNKKGFTIMFTSLFMLILLNNMFGFWLAHHLTFTL